MAQHAHDTVVVAAPRASVMEVERARPAQLPDSKRYWKIEKQEIDLTGQLGELEQGTRRRNREFEAKLRAIEERMLGLEAGIHREIQESEQAHNELFGGLRERLKMAAVGIEAKAEADITDRFEPGMHEHGERIAADDARVEEFVSREVPKIVDEQSGVVTRKLQKAHETFDIENAKIAKREQKILARFAAHVNDTGQSFEDEKSTRMAKLWLLGEDLEGTEYMDDRGDDGLQISVVKTIKETRQDVAELSAERARQDGLLLDSLAQAQQKLQRSILETFGMTDEDMYADDRHGRRLE